MTKQFNSVNEMIKNESSENFYLQLCIHTIQSVFKWVKLPSIIQDVCYMYQDKRFYMDEYSEQEQLRFDWLFKNHHWVSIPDKSDFYFSNTSDIDDLFVGNFKWIGYTQQELEQDKLGNFLSNRFLKRS